MRLTTPDALRRHLPLDDSTVHVFEVGDRALRADALGYAAWFYVLGVPLTSVGMLAGLAWLSPKLGFWAATLLLLFLGGRSLLEYARQLAGRPPLRSAGWTAFEVLWCAACTAFLLATPGPVREGLATGSSGLAAWLQYFGVQALDVALAGLPRALGLGTMALSPQTWPARLGLAAFNVAVGLALVELVRTLLRLHLAQATRRDTVRGLTLQAATAVTIDPGDEVVETNRGVDVRCLALVEPLAPTPVDAATLRADDPDPKVYRWEVAPQIASRARGAAMAGMGLALPLLSAAGAWALGTVAGRLATPGLLAAAAGLFLWRVVSLRRTLAGSALEHRAATALSIQLPTLVALGFVVQAFAGDGPIRDGLALPPAPGFGHWLHFFAYQVTNAVFLDVPDCLGVLQPAIAASSKVAAVALSAFKLVVGLGLVEGLVALWRAHAGGEEVYATRAELAKGLARLPRRRRDLSLRITHVEAPRDEPLEFPAGLLERAWTGELARERAGRLPPRLAKALPWLAWGAALVALWAWGPEVQRPPAEAPDAHEEPAPRPGIPAR